MDEENVKELLDRVERIAQCPVCLEIVSAPVVQCLNGHVSCSQCKNGRRNCHVCLSPFSETSTRVLEQLLSALPKMCPNQGCGIFTLLETHAQCCVYRPVMCRMGEDVECGWSGTVKEWLFHVIQKHSNANTCYLFNVTECLYFKHFSGGWNFRCYYHKVGGENFLSYVWKKGNEFYHTFRHVECVKPKYEYFFRISYKCGSRVIYKSLIKALPLSDDESMKNNPAVFLIDDLNSVLNGDDKLPVFIEAFKKSLSQ